MPTFSHNRTYRMPWVNKPVWAYVSCQRPHRHRCLPPSPSTRAHPLPAGDRMVSLPQLNWERGGSVPSQGNWAWETDAIFSLARQPAFAPKAPCPMEQDGKLLDAKLLQQLFLHFGGMLTGGLGAPWKQPCTRGHHNSLPWISNKSHLEWGGGHSESKCPRPKECLYNSRGFTMGGWLECLGLASLYKPEIKGSFQQFNSGSSVRTAPSPLPNWMPIQARGHQRGFADRPPIPSGDTSLYYLVILWFYDYWVYSCVSLLHQSDPDIYVGTSGLSISNLVFVIYCFRTLMMRNQSVSQGIESSSTHWWVLPPQ